MRKPTCPKCGANLFWGLRGKGGSSQCGKCGAPLKALGMAPWYAWCVIFALVIVFEFQYDIRASLGRAGTYALLAGWLILGLFLRSRVRYQERELRGS